MIPAHGIRVSLMRFQIKLRVENRAIKGGLIFINIQPGTGKVL